jgi:Glycosyltransferase family 87
MRQRRFLARSQDWQRVLWPALSVGGLIVLWSAFRTPGAGFDFYAYWAVDPGHPYDRMFDTFNAFRYAPPLIWLAGPLKLLPFETAYLIWFAIEVGILVYLTGRWAPAWLMFLPVTSELYHGNVHLLLAGALVLGFRWPAMWAFLPLAKLTTGVVLLDSLLRREWRRLSAVLVAVIVLAVASAIVTPTAWPEWIGRLVGPGPMLLDEGGDAVLRIPLVLRLVAAILVTTWAAATGRRWPLAVALTLSLPLLWIHGLSILAAIPRLRVPRPNHRADLTNVPSLPAQAIAAPGDILEP